MPNTKNLFAYKIWKRLKKHVTYQKKLFLIIKRVNPDIVDSHTAKAFKQKGYKVVNAEIFLEACEAGIITPDNERVKGCSLSCG